MDLDGNVLFIGSLTAILLGLLMGRVTFPWSSANVVAPLVLGVVGWAAFPVYESRIAEPTVPRRLFHHQNATIEFFLAFHTGVFLASPANFLPLDFQSLKGASPLVSEVGTLPLNTLMMPAAVLSGAFMARSGFVDRYMQWLGSSLPSDSVYYYSRH